MKYLISFFLFVVTVVPTSAFADSFTAADAGVPEVNGCYSRTGDESDGYPVWENESGFFAFYNSGGYGIIDVEWPQSNPIYYYADPSYVPFDSATWNVADEGVSPVPSFTYSDDDCTPLPPPVDGCGFYPQFPCYFELEGFSLFFGGVMLYLGVFMSLMVFGWTANYFKNR